MAAYWKWLAERGGGGPPTRLPPEGPLQTLDERQEALLDRFDTHTRHCPSCMGVRRPVPSGQLCAIACNTLPVVLAEAWMSGVCGGLLVWAVSLFSVGTGESDRCVPACWVVRYW